MVTTETIRQLDLLRGLLSYLHTALKENNGFHMSPRMQYVLEVMLARRLAMGELPKSHMWITNSLYRNEFGELRLQPKEATVRYLISVVSDEITRRGRIMTSGVKLLKFEFPEWKIVRGRRIGGESAIVALGGEARPKVVYESGERFDFPDAWSDSPWVRKRVEKG